MKTKFATLENIYALFEEQTQMYRQSAVCAKRCTYCCINAGSIDITTLEGLVILTHLKSLPRPRQVPLTKALEKDAKRREQNKPSPCPFLLKNSACGIYEIRPFSCRRIYSLKKCNPGQPPEIHSQVMDLSTETIRKLQTLDITGYSGHISFILEMLKAPKFLATYLAGEFKPEEIMVYGKKHRIVINKMVI